MQNPWLFSASVGQIAEYEPLLGRAVAVRYHQLQKKLTAFHGDTDYRVDEIVAIDQAHPAVGACAVSGSGARSAGTRVGRIVKSTVKGTLVQDARMHCAGRPQRQHLPRDVRAQRGDA